MLKPRRCSILYDDGQVWVNDFVNQQIMLDTFFSALAPEKSLVFLYAKRTPLTDDPRRVLVGVGRITSVGPAQEHSYSEDSAGKLRGVMWERPVSHSIRPDGFDGFVLPYQELLALAERDGTIDPAQFVAFAPDEGFEAFSNVAEHVDHDLAIASLLSLADKVRVIAKHISGAWDRHLEWISERLSELWQLRGAFPGLGSALHAFEIRCGTLFAMDLAQRYCVDGQWKEDPWALVSSAFEDPTAVLSPQVASQVQPFDGKRLAALPSERLELLKLLSRFSLTIEQASRFFNTEGREGLTDEEILNNPYRLFEADRHRLEAVTIGTIDRGMFPDQSVREAFPLPEISRLEGDQDPRRVRALAVHVLADAEANGHMLADPSGAFLERRLIHRTSRGELVRSISEVVVADALNAEGIEYHYEKVLRGADGIERYPDFTAEDPATGVTVYWEHLGMLSDPTYANRW